MMGRTSGTQSKLFYDICLEDYVPQGHLLRAIDLHLDLGNLRGHLRPFYSHTGRPSVDPELMVRMLLIGYCFGIRSERRLCEEVQVNLAYRWFCRLGLDEAVPEHSTFSKTRHGRFRDSDAFRFLFEEVVRQAMVEGLVGGEGFAVDASAVKADANRQRGVAGDVDVDWGAPEQVRRPIREYLDSLEACEPPKARKNLSLTDPMARWTAAPGGPAFYAYSTNYLVDIHAGIIVDVEATPAYRGQEVTATRTMVERVEARFSMKPKRLIGDTAYGTAEMLGWLVEEKAIEPHVPVWDKSDGKAELFGRSDFTWDAATDRYVCPGGKPLLRHRYKPRGTGITKENTIIYRATTSDCRACALKTSCCPNTRSRKIHRSVYEDARDVARQLKTTALYAQSRRDRKKVEMLFGHLKRILKLDRLRLRGMSGAHDEFLLAATAQNLRRLALWPATGPPPATSAPG